MFPSTNQNSQHTYLLRLIQLIVTVEAYKQPIMY